MESLVLYASKHVRLTDLDKKLIAVYFKPIKIKRKEFLVQDGQVFDFIAYLDTGIIRHFHIKDGNEITCDITLKNNFITDFKSLNENAPSNYSFQALRDSYLYIIKREELKLLYAQSRRLESFGRIMAEQVAQRNIAIAMSLSSDKPEERVKKLLSQRPDLFQEVPQRYLANLIGITPESLSRIRARLKS